MEGVTPEPGFAGVPYGEQNFAGLPYGRQNFAGDPVAAMTPLPKPAAGVDPASAAYRIEAHAFNALTMALAPDVFIPLSERQAVAQAVVAAVEPVIRADERALAAPEPQPAPGCPDPSQHRDVYGRPLPDTMPQPVPGETELRRRIEDVARGLDHRVSAGSRTRMAVASSSLARILRDILAETAAGPEPQAAPELAGSVVRVISTAPELREAMAETRQLRDYLDDFTRAVIDLDAGRNGNFARAAKSVRKKAGLAPVEGK